jgi:UDP-galactopyranose mutase
VVVRISAAYPLFDVGYQEHVQVLCDYLERFDNLMLAGRSGRFRYFNMDQTIASGLTAAQELLGRDIEMGSAVGIGGAR